MNNIIHFFLNQGLLNSGGTTEVVQSDSSSMIPLGTMATSAGHLGSSGNGNAENNQQQVGTGAAVSSNSAANKGTETTGPTDPNKSKLNKKNDPKEIMKKRRERAICIDRVSRVIFPSTFILLNIIYWLVFSEILEAIQHTTGIDMGSFGDDDGH